MNARWRLAVVVGLGVLVSVSTAVQGLQGGSAQAQWRPLIVLGAVAVGVAAIWQLIVPLDWHRSSSPEPAPREPRGRLVPVVISAVALVVALAALAIQLWSRPASDSRADRSGSVSPSPSASLSPSPGLTASGSPGQPSSFATMAQPSVTATRSQAKPPPAVPCIVGQWSLTEGEMYTDIDPTPPVDTLTARSGALKRSYAANGSGRIDYIGYHVQGTSTTDGSVTTYAYNGSATFTYTIVQGRLDHQLIGQSGTITYDRNGQAYSPNPITYFAAGTEGVTCHGDTLTVDSPLFHEVFERD